MPDSQPQLTDGDFEGETDGHGEIEFKNVSFAYPGSPSPILKNINLKIHSGETVAIMGAMGCGKSSLVHLIRRFYDATADCVCVDGMDVRRYSIKALRQKVAIALQKSELFNQSISENIGWGDPDADDGALYADGRVAQADKFIHHIQDQYQTMVAEKGMSLSGGQRQRISIARAILKCGEILIFDDATSALDLNQAHPGCTKIIIAQRIASVRRADRIVVLENGCIVACGNHDELLKGCKTYRDIYDSQMGKEDQHGG